MAILFIFFAFLLLVALPWDNALAMSAIFLFTILFILSKGRRA